MHPLPTSRSIQEMKFITNRKATIREALEQGEGQYPHAPCCSPASRERRAGLRPTRSARLRSLATRPGAAASPAAAAAAAEPPGHAARPGSGRGPPRRAPRSCTPAPGRRAPNAAARAGRRGCSPGAPSAQGPPAGRQVDRSRTRGRELIPGARRPDCAASGLPAPALSLRIQAGGGRAGSSFPLLRPESH